ncbi:hypothetical protein ACO0QE_004710 [Hanseniaspora vineae]
MSHEVGLISSYKLTPGLQSLNQERDISKPISIEKFMETGVSMVKMCHSYSYLFINLPGVTRTDFMENERSFPELQKYLELSSSIAKYEKIDFHEQDPAKIYKDVIRATRLGCNISLKNVLQMEGNNTDSFVPYYDTAPRIIKIDFPEMPTHGTSMAEKRARTTALKEFDKFIGYVLGHLPTPEFSMMLTTSPGSGNLEDVMKNEDIEINESAGIFPSVFNVKSRSKEYERNQRPKKIPKPQFKPYVPMQQSMIEKAQIYPTAFSIDFLIENEDILVKVLTSLVVSIALYFFMANPLDKGPALKKGKLVKNTEKQGKLDTLAPAKTTVTNIKDSPERASASK